MNYSVGDKVEFIDFQTRTRTAYLMRICTPPSKQHSFNSSYVPLWEMKFTRSGHEFFVYKKRIIRKISSDFKDFKPN